MSKLSFTLIVCFGLSMAAYSQQIFDARESLSPAQSTKTSLSLNEYGDLTIIYFLNTENDITGGLNLVEMRHEGRKDISASVNDSVYLAPRYTGFTLQSRPVNGNFYYTDYISPEYEGAVISGGGKRVMAGGVYYTLDYDYDGDNFSGGNYFRLTPQDTLWRGFTEEGARHYMSMNGTRYATQQTFYQGSDSLKKVIVYTVLNESQEWVGGFLEFTHHQEEVFEIAFTEDVTGFNLINNKGIHKYKFPASTNLTPINNANALHPPKAFLPSLNDDFSVNHEFSPKIVVEQTSYNGLIKLTLDDYGLIQVYSRENRESNFSFVKEFYLEGYKDENWKQEYTPVSIASNEQGSLVGLSLIMNYQVQEQRKYRVFLMGLDVQAPELEELLPTGNPLLFELTFSEQVYDVNPKSFEVTLNGEVADPDLISVRATNRISDDRYQMSFRTNTGPVSGVLNIGLSDSSSVKDLNENSANKNTKTNDISIENLDALARVLKVPEDFEDLQEIIDYGGDGDTVLVAEGVYAFNYISIDNKDITLVSNYSGKLDNQEAVLNTILDSEISVNSRSVTISGFTVRNGISLSGNWDDADKKNKYVISNNNLIGGNDAGLSAQGEVDLFLFGNVIQNNGGHGIELYDNVQGTVSDNIIINNKGYEGAGIYIDNSDPAILNNLIAYNKAYDYGGGLFASRSFSTLLNNIIWGNEAKRGDQLFQGEGLPFIDHSVVQNYGKGTNVLAREGDNIYTEDPFLEISQEPITPKEGNTVVSRFGVYVSISDSSILFGNGRSTVFDKYIVQTREPIPLDSDADIGPFEFKFSMVVNPLIAPQLVYPLELDENPGIDPLFEWEQVKYSTGYEMMISTKKDFSENVSTHKSDRNFMSLDTPLDSSHEKYYWKVRGINSTKKGDWSDTQMFNVGIINSNEPTVEITDYELYQNYPNPFNPTTRIQYALPEFTNVKIEIFNSLGQKLAELVNEQQNAGIHEITFKLEGLSTGVYLYKLTTPFFTESKKMLLIK